MVLGSSKVAAVLGQPKTKAHLKAKYESSGHVAGVTLSVHPVAHSDVKLKTSFTDATFINGPSLDGLSLGLEKPGHFLFDYDLAHQVWAFPPCIFFSI
jgi:hypothetical protein